MLAAACIVLTIAAAAGLMARHRRPDIRHDTREALKATFDRDIRNLVYRWDPDDPRSEPQRRAALFDFIYQTYDSSAWIPQSLFDSNLITQAVIGDVGTIVGKKVGLVVWREHSVVPAYGMAPSGRADLPLRWTVNCMVCHTAEIDGVAYLGAGTKMFDDRWLGDALKTLTSERWRSVLPATSTDRALAADAYRILTSHHHEKIDSLTRARSTAFAASHVELFLRPNGALPPAGDVGRGDTKTPPLWHTAAKMPSQRWYVDGSFHGRFPLMASSMELEKTGRSPRSCSRSSPPSKRSSSRSSVIFGRRHIRTRSIARSPRAARSCSIRRTSAARAATVSTTAEGTSNGRPSTRMSAPIVPASRSCRSSSSRPSTRARSPPKAISSGAGPMPPRL